MERRLRWNSLQRPLGSIPTVTMRSACRYIGMPYPRPIAAQASGLALSGLTVARPTGELSCVVQSFDMIFESIMFAVPRSAKKSVIGCVSTSDERPIECQNI
jgi:hypothetical protein